MELPGIQKGIYSFPKEERLHHRSLVEGLYRFGKSFYEFPFRVSWRILTKEELDNNFRNNVPDGIAHLQMMVTIPKKRRKRAVDRVQMRRRIKESYRLNRHQLRERVNNMENIGTMSLSLVYIHDKNLPYLQIDEKMKILLTKLQERISKWQSS